MRGVFLWLMSCFCLVSTALAGPIEDGHSQFIEGFSWGYPSLGAGVDGGNRNGGSPLQLRGRMVSSGRYGKERLPIGEWVGFCRREMPIWFIIWQWHEVNWPM